MGAFGEAAIYCAFEMDFSNILDFTLFISVWATAENANKRWIVIYLLWTHREYYIGVIAVCNAHCAVLSMANLSYSFMCLRSPMAIVFDWLKFKMIQNSGLESQRVDKREREKRACEKAIARKSEEKQKVSSVAKQTQKKKTSQKIPATTQSENLEMNCGGFIIAFNRISRFSYATIQRNHISTAAFMVVVAALNISAFGRCFVSFPYLFVYNPFNCLRFKNCWQTNWWAHLNKCFNLQLPYKTHRVRVRERASAMPKSMRLNNELDIVALCVLFFLFNQRSPKLGDCRKNVIEIRFEIVYFYFE